MRLFTPCIIFTSRSFAGKPLSLQTIGRKKKQNLDKFRSVCYSSMFRTIRIKKSRVHTVPQRGSRHLSLHSKQMQWHPLRSISAPPSLLRPVARITALLSPEEVRERARLRVHLAGACTACSYFALKPDGCRLGKDCARCHWCTEEEARKQQKKRRVASKARARLYAMNGMGR